MKRIRFCSQSLRFGRNFLHRISYERNLNKKFSSTVAAPMFLVYRKLLKFWKWALFLSIKSAVVVEWSDIFPYMEKIWTTDAKHRQLRYGHFMKIHFFSHRGFMDYSVKWSTSMSYFITIAFSSYSLNLFGRFIRRFWGKNILAVSYHGYFFRWADKITETINIQMKKNFFIE